MAGQCGLPAWMLELHQALRAVTVHAFGKPREAGILVVIIRNKPGYRRAPCFSVRRRSAYNNQAGSALRYLGVMIYVARGDRAVRMRAAYIRRHMAYAVWYEDIPDNDWLKQMGKRLHSNTSCLSLAWLQSKADWRGIHLLSRQCWRIHSIIVSQKGRK